MACSRCSITSSKIEQNSKWHDSSGGAKKSGRLGLDCLKEGILDHTQFLLLCYLLFCSDLLSEGLGQSMNVCVL